MCEYCNGGKPLAIKNTGDKGMAIIYGGILNAYGYCVQGDGSNGICAKINYCPMCGSKINERKQSD